MVNIIQGDRSIIGKGYRDRKSSERKKIKNEIFLTFEEWRN